ncbi:hypothetical protein WME99_24145 [Sorangium sp. So ce136]|uniref:hypothetical protein n=1 Tax=Sorangium sp. So ce136 TaxID=3133284 RepID=UPI003F0857B5
MDDLGAGEQALLKTPFASASQQIALLRASPPLAAEAGFMRPTAISTSAPHPGSQRRNTITVVFHAQGTA